MARKAFLTFFILAGCFLFIASDAYAIFNLSVAPRRGGQSVRFEAARPGSLLRNEEVTLTVTTTQAVQYRITQTVYQPLTNEFGNTIPQGAFIAFSPSNPLGTLRTQLETPVMMGQQLIYTSNAAGDSDSFVLVYNVRVPEDQPGGVYHTNVTFTAEPVVMQGGVSPSVVTLDIRVEINPAFRMVIQSTKGSQSLDLGRISKENPMGTGTLKMAIDANIGTTYRVVQQMTEPLVSQEGVPLDETALTFTTSSGNQGSLKAVGSPLQVPLSPTVLYTSSESGAGDVLLLQYQLAPESKQKAGVYSGNISFKVESNSAFIPSQAFNVPVRIEIEPVFYLDMEVAQGTNLNFGVFRSGDEKQEKKVLLTVHSNLGQPYQVSQIVPRKLTNEEGTVIPRENFMFFGSEAQTGTLSVMSPTAVQEGETVVFTSDKAGSPEKFSLNYALTVPKGTRGGSYNSEVKYSMTTL